MIGAVQVEEVSGLVEDIFGTVKSGVDLAKEVMESENAKKQAGATAAAQPDASAQTLARALAEKAAAEKAASNQRLYLLGGGVVAAAAAYWFLLRK